MTEALRSALEQTLCASVAFDRSRQGKSPLRPYENSHFCSSSKLEFHVCPLLGTCKSTAVAAGFI